MTSNGLNNRKRYKKPKQKTQKTTNPGPSKPRNPSPSKTVYPEPTIPLQAKDSEWVDVLSAPKSLGLWSSSNITEEEELLQLVDCEDDIQLKPLVLMFPGLLERDPQTLQGILDRVMSTTEVTKQLVSLGQKADFTFMKKSNKLIPRDKQWLESVAEDTSSLNDMIPDEYLLTDSDVDISSSISTKQVLADRSYSSEPLTKNNKSLPKIVDICDIDTLDKGPNLNC